MAKINDLVENYDSIMNEISARKAYGPAVENQPGTWLLDYVQKLHPRKVKMKVTDIFEVTSSTKSIHLSPVDTFLPPFQAGQYIEIFINVDGIHTGRAYSLSSSPKERSYYEITVRRKEGGLISNYLLDELKIGDIVETSSPNGNIYYNPLFHKKHSVFLAGGSGITPFLSMIREVTDSSDERNIHLIYGARTPEDVPYIDELMERAKKHPNFKCDLVISDPTVTNWDGPRGFITADLLKELGVNPQESTFYICGPHAMYTFLDKELEKLEIPAKQIRKEMFGMPDVITEEVGWPKDIAADAQFTITYRNKTYPAKAGESILTSLERAGIIHDSCCRSGECSICRMKLVSGEVYQSPAAKMRRADQRDGYIHVCASYPISDIVVAD